MGKRRKFGDGEVVLRRPDAALTCGISISRGKRGKRVVVREARRGVGRHGAGRERVAWMGLATHRGRAGLCVIDKA